MSFKDDLASILGANFNEVWQSFFSQKQVGFFISALGLEQKERIFTEFKELNLKEILPNFYLVGGTKKPILSASSSFNEGLIYIQNPSSYLSALNLNASLNDEICDMCASPGGKSIALCALFALNFKNYEKNALKFACIEANKDRFFSLKKNLLKYSLTNIKTFNKDARSISRTCKERFTRIILDAPCSSYSHFSENFKEKSIKEIKALSKLQKELLNAGLIALKCGGELVYSTCTFYPQENEQVIQNALNSKFKIQILKLDFLPQNARQNDFGALILPNEIYDGFFITRIKKLA